MARHTIKVPDIGEGTTEAEIVAWHVRVGDTIAEDDPIAEVMTDKATVEIPSPVTGTIVARHGEVGERRPVGSELVVLETEATAGASPAPIAAAAVEQPLSPPAGRASPPTLRPAYGEGDRQLGDDPPRRPVVATEAATIGFARPVRAPGDRPLAAPAVRKRAWELGIALQFVPGTGPGGRITRADLGAYLTEEASAPGHSTASTAPAAPSAPPARPAPPAAAVPLAPPPREDAVEAVPVVGLRRVIAERMQQSKRQIPHFSYIEEVEVGALEDLRAQLNTQYPERPHLTLLSFLMRAIVRAAAAYPQVNARFDDEAGILNRHRAVHIGVATQTPAGLLVPVVRHAEALDLWQVAAELARLTEIARAGKASRDELAGSTITVTSLGRLGGIAATPVINRPEVAIVGVNRIVERPVVRTGQIGVARMMNLSSSFDHRIVDGWEAASFIQNVKNSLEHPATMFII